MSEQQLSNILSGRQGVGSDLAARAARAFGVSPGWLLFGEQAEPPATAGVADGSGRYRRGLRLPVVGRASASGEPNVVWEPIEPPEWKELPADARLIEVRGDSMRPLVWDGQHVIAAPFDGEPADRDLVVAELTGGEQLFKRWWASEGVVTLESLRTDVPEKPIVVRRRQVRRVWRIVGVLF